jgi:hypothetical protein
VESGTGSVQRVGGQSLNVFRTGTDTIHISMDAITQHARVQIQNHTYGAGFFMDHTCTRRGFLHMAVQGGKTVRLAILDIKNGLFGDCGRSPIVDNVYQRS